MSKKPTKLKDWLKAFELSENIRLSGLTLADLEAAIASAQWGVTSDGSTSWEGSPEGQEVIAEFLTEEGPAEADGEPDRTVTYRLAVAEGKLVLTKA